MNKRAELYTQDKNTCTLHTILNIWRMNYGIILNKREQQEFIDQAEKDGVWSEEKGAIFVFIYNWATSYFYKKYGLEIEVISVDILGKEFEELNNKGMAFGIGLLYAGNWYKKVREDQEITLEEIKNSNKEEEKYYGHNLVWKLNYIVGILKSIPYDRKLIKFSLEALKEGINKGFFWSTARTFKIKDELIHFYLREMSKGTKFKGIEFLGEEKKTAFYKAMELRILRK